MSKNSGRLAKLFGAFSEYLNFNKSQVLTLLLYISENSLKSHWQNRHYILLCNHITILFSKLCTYSKKTQKMLHNLLLGLFSYGRRMKDFSHPSDLVNLVLQGKLLIPPPLKNVDVIFGWPLFQKLLKICCNKKCFHMAE